MNLLAWPFLLEHPHPPSLAWGGKHFLAYGMDIDWPVDTNILTKLVEYCSVKYIKLKH